MPDVKRHIPIADILYYGAPVRMEFVVLTPFNATKGIRRIPVDAQLAGENSPLVRSYYRLELVFNGNGDFTYNLESLYENSNGFDSLIENEVFHEEAIRDFLEVSFLNGDTAKEIEKWTD